MSSNSVCNHTRVKQITNQFVIARMITDRIGLHSVLLPLHRDIFSNISEGTALPLQGVIENDSGF